MKRYIYLILSSSSSLPAKIIKFSTQNEINHASLSLDSTLTKMFSFGRLKMNQPFNAGFVVENKNKGFYKKFTDTKILLYRLPVDEKTFRKVSDYLHRCAYEKENLRYNFIGAIFSRINRPVARKEKYFCSEFVAIVLKKFKVCKITKNVHTFQPYDFLEIDNKELIYDGLLSKYIDTKGNTAA